MRERNSKTEGIYLPDSLIFCCASNQIIICQCLLQKANDRQPAMFCTLASYFGFAGEYCDFPQHISTHLDILKRRRTSLPRGREHTGDRV
jgi:hypothetical protein